jgi:hypothetical protein
MRVFDWNKVVWQYHDQANRMRIDMTTRAETKPVRLAGWVLSVCLVCWSTQASLPQTINPMNQQKLMFINTTEEPGSSPDAGMLYDGPN